MKAILVESHDATYNLALEQALFESLTPDAPGYFLLWHNSPSIIIGRHQNTLEEVNQELTARYNLPVVRRMTGGGAVYHDRGNLNFSFLQPKAGQSGPMDFGIFLRPIVEALGTLGVQAEFSSRNDLTAGGRKISGSAQLRRPQGVLHHGTLLVDLDLDMLDALLTGSPDKYTSKGIASVRSRVTNLREIMPVELGMDDIKGALLARCSDGQVSVPESIAAAAEALAQSRYRTWDWNFGASPAFTEQKRHRFPWGVVECRLSVRQGSIVECRIYGDFFAQREMQALEKLLIGQRHTEEDVQAALAGLDSSAWEQFFAGCNAAEMRDFLCRA